jgi:hypothetical protein
MGGPFLWLMGGPFLPLNAGFFYNADLSEASRIVEVFVGVTAFTSSIGGDVLS